MARDSTLQLIQQSEFAELIGRENICDNVQEAIQRAEEIFEKINPVAKGAAQEPSHSSAAVPAAALGRPRPTLRNSR